MIKTFPSLIALNFPSEPAPFVSGWYRHTTDDDYVICSCAACSCVALDEESTYREDAKKVRANALSCHFCGKTENLRCGLSPGKFSFLEHFFPSLKFIICSAEQFSECSGMFETSSGCRQKKVVVKMKLKVMRLHNGERKTVRATTATSLK